MLCFCQLLSLSTIQTSEAKVDGSNTTCYLLQLNPTHEIFRANEFAMWHTHFRDEVLVLGGGKGIHLKLDMDLQSGTFIHDGGVGRGLPARPWGSAG